MASRETGHDSPIFLLFLIITAIVCGALVMVVEVLGSRVIGPFFGVSLFVWTALITVTLVALAVGYAAGGILADRWGSPDGLYALILAAGVLVMLVPFLKAGVIRVCLPLGLRAGAMASAAMLFALPLVLLGCVSPYIVRIGAREMGTIGRTVGLFYAVSTAGSFAGTVLTGFVLIAYLGVAQAFVYVGAVPVILSAAYFLFYRRKRALACVALLAPLLLFLLPAAYPRSKTLPDGTVVTTPLSRDGFYGNVTVVDMDYGHLRTRNMLIDGQNQGGIDLRNGMSLYGYSYLLGFLPYALNPGGRTCLVIGLGAGIIPLWYEARGVRTDVIDINPDVVEIAREYFGFRVSGEVIIDDARYFLAGATKKYDYIVLDVFNGDTTPGHLLSVEALRLVKERLSPGGIFAINLIGSLRPGAYMTASIAKTLEQVFRTVDFYPVDTVELDKGFGSISVIAYEGPRVAIDLDRVRGFPLHPNADSLWKNFGKRIEFGAGTPAIVLTDDYNPMDFYDTWLKEEMRGYLVKYMDWDIFL